MRAEGRDCAITAMTDRSTGWRLLGCISDQENQKNLININIGTLMAGVIGLIFGCVIAVLTALSFNREIKKLQNATHRVAGGDFSEKIKVTRSDEFGVLETNFNGMMDDVSGLCLLYTSMHFRCYEEREDVGAVLHAHPPVATGFAVADIPLDEYSMIETVLALGSVPIAPYATPSTDEVPDAITPYLQEHDAILLKNHGAVTVGADVYTA